mmetsp:Transcript_108882/g.283936  ORF Transcript_108882/g.283936 Transcript_108882/m.283936 type:complete len:214 (-) Transcript_108882:313-954(-)
MVCRHRHALRLDHREHALCPLQGLHDDAEILLVTGLLLLGGTFCCLLIVEVLAAVAHAVFQALLQHQVVLLRVRFRLPEGTEIFLRLLLEVLHQVDEPSGVRLVDCRGWCARQLIVSRVLVLRRGLHQRHQFVLVSGGQRRCVDHGAERLHHGLEVGVVDLSERGRVLLHLLGDNADGTLQGVHCVHELRLVRLEFRRLFLPDCSGGVEVLAG